MVTPDPKNPRDESFKEKLTEKLERLKKEDRVENIFNFAKTNTKDTVAYIILIVGLILLVFMPFYGSFLIGLVSGIYFSDEIIFIAKHLNELIEEQGIVRVLILGALILAFFIVAPFIFIGAAIGILINKLIAQK